MAPSADSAISAAVPPYSPASSIGSLIRLYEHNRRKLVAKRSGLTFKLLEAR